MYVCMAVAGSISDEKVPCTVCAFDACLLFLVGGGNLGGKPLKGCWRKVVGERLEKGKESNHLYSQSHSTSTTSIV